MAPGRGSFHGVPSRARAVIWWRWIAAVVAVCFLAVAFLLWGPIGFGSGPLTVYTPSGGQILGPQNQDWGLVVGIQAGTSQAVIDQVAAVGGAGYSGPHVLSVLEATDQPGQCGGTAPWEGPDSITSGCGIIGLRSVVGMPLPGNNPGVNMIFKIGPPDARSGCWTLTAIVVHYHVGIRHYTLTSTGEFAACKTAAESDREASVLGLPD
ncbi:MAG TPA: hypothetical protein VMA32_13835 [Streptosporangiaceae bacterium]|nr:hypothetical protein [Streptosporangiaceae bacterium]